MSEYPEGEEPRTCSQCKQDLPEMAFLTKDDSICSWCWDIIEGAAMDDSHLYDPPEGSP